MFYLLLYLCLFRPISLSLALTSLVITHSTCHLNKKQREGKEVEEEEEEGEEQEKQERKKKEQQVEAEQKVAQKQEEDERVMNRPLPFPLLLWFISHPP